jgi:hypothetical protein
MKQPDFKPVWPLKENQKVIAFTVLMVSKSGESYYIAKL